MRSTRKGSKSPQAGLEDGCGLPTLGTYSITFAIYSQIYRKEGKHGISSILGARLQGGCGWPQGTVLPISRFSNFQDFDFSLGNE